MSSIEKEVQKVLVRFVSIGPKACDEVAKRKLLENAQQIMDKDRLRILESYIDRVAANDCTYENLMVYVLF